MFCQTKKAVTLIELIFVIVIIGILSAVIAPNFTRATLTEAANQVISHIRYTQHLALVDNRFNPTNPQWFQERWQIRFFENLTFRARPENYTYNKIWAYAIYSDDPTYTHKPGLLEMARNPHNPNQYMSGGYNNVLLVNDEKSMKSMRLGEHYNIKDIDFGGGCKSRQRYIIFDNLGRPYNGYNKSRTFSSKLIVNRCTIMLCTVTDCKTAKDNEKIIIAIEPETGYTHIL